MKRAIISLANIFLIVVLGTGSWALNRVLWRGEIMSPDKVEQRWGQERFIPEKFKDALPETRAKMAFDLLRQQKKYLGKSPSEIRKELGDWDGYYFTDIFPAYFIEVAKTRDKDSWQIVFFLDRNKKVSEIAVHKNCCDHR